MKRKIIILVLVILLIILAGVFYYFKIYMSDRNVMERYLASNGYNCVGNNCTKKEKSIKYNYDLKTKDLYVSTNKYAIAIGYKYPILRFKSGGKVCNYEIDDYHGFTFIKYDTLTDGECEAIEENFKRNIWNEPFVFYNSTKVLRK